MTSGNGSGYGAGDEWFDDMDEEFPRAPVADDEVDVVCPYCSETVTIALDAGGGSNQEYVEDCQVCCRPWHLRVSYDDEGVASVSVDPAQ